MPAVARRLPWTDRFVGGLLRTLASALVFAGVSLVIAAIPVWGVVSGAPLASTIGLEALAIGGTFVIGGAAASYLTRSRQRLLPNEQVDATTRPARAGVAGWLLVLLLTLIAIPAYLILRLQRFLAEWRLVIGFLSTLDIFQGGGANMSGVLLVPLAGALTPPAIELFAMIAFFAAAATLITLLLRRSSHFPRLYLAWLALLAALVLASYLGSEAAQAAARGVERLIPEAPPSPSEMAQVREVLVRYTTVVRSTVFVLSGALLALLVWVPALLTSRRALATFAPPAIDRNAASHDVDLESITSHSRL